MSKKLYSFRLPPELMDALREQADQKETSVTELLTRLINQEVSGTREGSEARTGDQGLASLRQELQTYVDNCVDDKLEKIVSIWDSQAD